MLTDTVKERAQYWAKNPLFDDATRKEIQSLIDQNNDKELTDRFYRDLEFGTGGLRGVLGGGTARMNIYNIRKATTAFARHLLAVFPNEKLKIGITHDSRRYSREFAEITACT